MKPMLACDYDPAKLKYPCIASPKLDGVRGLVSGGSVLSRSLKQIPNKFVQEMLGGYPPLDGFDGELIVGSPTDKNCYMRRSSRGTRPRAARRHPANAAARRRAPGSCRSG